jgi:transcriptional antiterminator Rof (Rho-off)
MACVFNLYIRFMLDGGNQREPTAVDLANVECQWVNEAQMQLNLEALKMLQPTIKDGVVVVGGHT